MAWTSPRTWSVAEFVTAALLNTHLRDNLLFLKSDPQLGIATSTTTTESVGGAGAVTILTISGLAIPADVGAVYVEAWASAFGHTTPSTTGWFQVRLHETTAGMLVRGGVSGDVSQRLSSGNVANFGPLYMRSRDQSWANSTRTITLVIESSACSARIVAQSDNPIVMRVMRSY